MSCLNKYPIDTLKIALPFIRDMLDDKQNEAIVSTIITMAHNFNMKIIAEGIETEEQLELLRTKKCDFGQGFLYSKPLPPNEFIQLAEIRGIDAWSFYAENE